MATSGEGNQPMTAATELHQSRVARKRLSEARHRATMTRIISRLRDILYHQSDLTASKWQVLNKAEVHIQEMEQTLDSLLKLKESFNLEDGNANTLEEVKEEYARNYSESDSVALSNFLEINSPPRSPPEAAGPDAIEEENEEEEEQEEGEEKNVDLHSAGTSSDLLEFERYLNFYKQAMDLLTDSSVVSPQEVALPVISAAISHLWQTLSEEMKDNLLQTWEQQCSTLPDLKDVACLELASLENGQEDSGLGSQGASCSLTSTPEEALFEDAFDVASFLDNNEAPSPLPVSSSTEQLEEKFQLYIQIVDFFKSLRGVNTQLNQEPTPPTDDEMIRLKCMETFDDEDL